MSQIKLDRLLETCYRRGTDLLFAPGSPPMLRTDQGWQPMQLPILQGQDVESLASDLVSDESASADGYSYSDFWYGVNAYFRAMAFGYPQTRFTLITRIPPPTASNKPPSRI